MEEIQWRGGADQSTKKRVNYVPSLIRASSWPTYGQKRDSITTGEEFRARSYEDYRKVAEGYGNELNKRYDEDLNTTLIFVSLAGLPDVCILTASYSTRAGKFGSGPISSGGITTAIQPRTRHIRSCPRQVLPVCVQKEKGGSPLDPPPRASIPVLRPQTSTSVVIDCLSIIAIDLGRDIPSCNLEREIHPYLADDNILDLEPAHKLVTYCRRYVRDSKP